MGKSVRLTLQNHLSLSCKNRSNPLTREQNTRSGPNERDRERGPANASWGGGGPVASPALKCVQRGSTVLRIPIVDPESIINGVSGATEFDACGGVGEAVWGPP